MPQASIDKDGHPGLWEEDVGHHSETANYDGQMYTKPQAATVKRRPQREFGFGVCPAVPAHDGGDRGRRWLGIWKAHRVIVMPRVILPGMPPKRSPADLTTVDGIKAWLYGAVRDYRWNVRGIILDDGKVIPLPKEPAVVAKVIEISVTEHFKRKAYAVPGLDLLDDLSGRGYPDVLLAGRAVENRRVALDVKVARRKPRRNGQPTKTQSRITLGPFDTYFRRPNEPIPGVGVAYGDMAWHLDLIVLYDWEEGEVKSVEVLVVETWRVGSMKRSSTTRNYIGAVDAIADLRNERGEFDTAADFYSYWRAQPIRRAELPLEPEQVGQLEAVGP